MSTLPLETLTMPLGTRAKLSAMMFLQYMMMPVWFNTVVPYVKTLPGGGAWELWCGMLMGLGMLASPLLCMFADRFLNAERVLALCNFAGAALLAGCFFAKAPATLFLLLLGLMFCYMPTWSLTSAIAMANSTTAAFPHIRVFGSVGWAASAVFSVVGIRFFGIVDFDKTPWIFASGACVALLGGLLALALPATPPRGRGTPMSVVDAFGLKAFALFRRPDFCVFAVLVTLGMVPFQWYMGYNTKYLDEAGFSYLSLVQNLGQVGELGLMLLLPFILRKLGYKWSMVLGLAALAVRYACFWGAFRLGWTVLDFGGILVHGLIFGLLIVGAQMYVNVVAPVAIRNQAQGLVMLLTGGVGAVCSSVVFDRILQASEKTGVNGAVVHDWSQPFLVAFVISVVLTVLMIVLFRPGKGVREEEAES